MQVCADGITVRIDTIRVYQTEYDTDDDVCNYSVSLCWGVS